MKYGNLLQNHTAHCQKHLAIIYVIKEQGNMIITFLQIFGHENPSKVKSGITFFSY